MQRWRGCSALAAGASAMLGRRGQYDWHLTFAERRIDQPRDAILLLRFPARDVLAMHIASTHALAGDRSAIEVKRRLEI